MGSSVLLFPGQGVQYIGMGKKLYDTYSLAKGIFHEASEYIGFDIAKFCFEGNKEYLNLTEYTQPMVLIAGYAAAKVLIEEHGYEPQYAAGHSLGEITSVTVAGGISFKEVVRFVKLRGILMQEAVASGEGAMSAIIGIDASVVKQICEDVSRDEFIVQVSNYNSPEQTVISGHKKAVEVAEELFTKLNAKIIRLSVSSPFHCRLMKPAADQLTIALDSITFRPMRFPVVSSVTGAPYMDEGKIKELWVNQLTRPVEWTKCMKFLKRIDIDTFVDAGPGDTMKNLVIANGYGHQTISLDKDEAAFEKVVIKNNQEFRYETKGLELIRRCLGIVISTPNAISNHEDYEKLVLNPFETLKVMYQKYSKEGHVPKKEDINIALDTIGTILRNKQVPEEECRKQVIDLLKETGYERED